MPLGWYLAQGLIPLGPSSSDDEEGPCALPNGRIVCGPHGLQICGRCCTDYSDMNNDLSEHSEEQEDYEYEEVRPITIIPYIGPDMVRGTGLVFPSKFTPRVSRPPMELFRGRVRFMNMVRYTYPNDNSKILLMADGACLNNGQANPKAGWAFVQGLNLEGQPLVASGALEKEGPWGDGGIQSSNRAELRAVIAALRFRAWAGEGFRTVIIATDSEYVVEGSTQWAKTWVQNGWKRNDGANVKNQDLWEMLLGECEKAHHRGLTIQFWKIPREWNNLADEGAKKAAAEEAPVEWMDCRGMAL